MMGIEKLNFYHHQCIILSRVLQKITEKQHKGHRTIGNAMQMSILHKIQFFKVIYSTLLFTETILQLPCLS